MLFIIWKIEVIRKFFYTNLEFIRKLLKYVILLDVFGNLVFYFTRSQEHRFRIFILLNSKTVSFLNGFNDIKKGIFKKYL